MYRREVLESVRGFDETCYWAHDADLAFRVRRSGRRLRFEPQSLVGHAHPTRLLPYLNKQRLQGYYRVLLYLRHPERISGDSYSGMTDHLQPPLAMMILASLPLLALPWFRWLPILLIGLLSLAQAPMTFQTVLATRQAKYLLYAPMSFLRAFYRGVGMMQAVVVESLARAFQSNRKGPLSPSSP
jgi:hypothetical protein